MPYKDKQDEKIRNKKYYQTHSAQIKLRRELTTKLNLKESSGYNIKIKYGLSLEDVDQILFKQNHKCAICGKNLVETKRCIDHCHKTKKVRGILCYKCNTALGFVEYFLDNPALWSTLFVYLKKESD